MRMPAFEGPCRHPAMLAIALLAISVASVSAQQQRPAQLATPSTAQHPTEAQPQPVPQTDTPGPQAARDIQPRNPRCIPITDAAATPISAKQEVCVTAHIYEVVELADGTRFLDVCPPEVKDENCRFLLMSIREDRETVGDLSRYRDQDVTVRGRLLAMHGRMGMVISHKRQFSGGPEKFKPNPRLLNGFSAQSGRMPVRDPNLAPSGHHRSFMNTSEKEVNLAKEKP